MGLKPSCALPLHQEQKQSPLAGLRGPGGCVRGLPLLPCCFSLALAQQTQAPLTSFLLLVCPSPFPLRGWHHHVVCPDALFLLVLVLPFSLIVQFLGYVSPPGKLVLDPKSKVYPWSLSVTSFCLSFHRTHRYLISGIFLFLSV